MSDGKRRRLICCHLLFCYVYSLLACYNVTAATFICFSLLKAAVYIYSLQSGQIYVLLRSACQLNNILCTNHLTSLFALAILYSFFQASKQAFKIASAGKFFSIFLLNCEYKFGIWMQFAQLAFEMQMLLELSFTIHLGI